MPLLEIIGVTSTEITFCVGFAYLHSEHDDNFVWALQMLKEHITSGEVEVIVIDIDLSSMNAVEYVFRKSMSLLCLFHICKNVKAKCKITVFPKKKQWLIPHKERFVDALANRVMHMGTPQHKGLSRCIGVHRYSNRLYTNLRGVVSKNVIDHIATEYARVKYVGVDQNECRCMIRITHGLPCTCEIGKLKLRVHPKKGKSNVSKRDKSTKRDPSWWEYVDASVRCSATNVCSTITTSKVQQPRSSVQKLTPRPSFNKVQEPRVILFNDWLPVEIHKFIYDIIDFGDDGNCGYRAVAGLLGICENSWAFIRQ
ncbi:uncharacterized protein [Cicer arietinum]|uniref:uncharacterized protein n=1 Tax=Cicer arietinum TaxID=3827 RepID=UPI003CC5AC6F